MSGHSKWANIKHKKAKEDASRGKAFTKIIKEITVAARDGGGDINGNPRLRTLVEKAKHLNMPQDNMKRAIQKGTGELPGVSLEQHMYEGYGPGGIALIVEMLTDNKNRAIAELRWVFSKKGGSLGETGTVNWMFNLKGVIKATGTLTEDELLEKLLECDVDTISKDDDLFIIITSVKGLEETRKACLAAGLKVEHAEIEYVAKDPVTPAPEDEEKAYEFIQALEELDDIQNVYSNIA